MMERYLVRTSAGSVMSIKADIAIVSDCGALTFRVDGQIVAAFSPTGWVSMRRED